VSYIKPSASWRVASLALCLVLCIPIFTILYSLLFPSVEIWQHLWDTRLGELIWNTIRLSLGVGMGSFLLGTSLAWFVVMYDFPGKKFFDWALILPLAMPAYVIGFVILTAFEYDGVVANILESLFGITGWYPDIRSWFTVVVVMTLVLYPYVYLLAKTAFREQNITLLEAAQSLGISRRRLFWKVALPMARPSIVAGVSLALMESLADFGTVGVFSYDTFTTAIYEVWFGLFDKVAATQLASLLLLFNFLLFWLEAKTRGQAKYFQTQGTIRTFRPFTVHGGKKILFFLYPATVLSFAFIFPVMILVYWASKYSEDLMTSRYWEFAGNTLLLGIVAGLVIIPMALFLAYGKRLMPGRLSAVATRAASMGYALPGSVIAVGALIPLAWTDHAINDLLISWDMEVVGLILTGSIFGLLFAYSVRFMTVAFNSLDSSLVKITDSMDMAARSLGESQWGVMRRVHLKLIKSGMFTGFILIMVDVMKEMPATLLMRPFGFDTLATWIWQLTSEGLAEEAALPALTIVLTGLIPILLLNRFEKKSGKVEVLY